MKKIHILLLMCLLILMPTLIFGCSPQSLTPEPLTPIQMDKSPFTGIPCSAPCWYGMTIGESSENDLISFLPTMTFIDQNSIQRIPRSYIAYNEVDITAKCAKPNIPCYTFYFVEDNLTEIDIQLNYEIRLYEAVELLGDPDYIVYRVTEPEQLICEVLAIWKSNQLVLSSQRYSGKNVEIICGNLRDSRKPYSNMLISKVYFLQNEKIDLLLANPEWVFKYSGMIQDQ